MVARPLRVIFLRSRPLSRMSVLRAEAVTPHAKKTDIVSGMAGLRPETDESVGQRSRRFTKIGRSIVRVRFDRET